MKFSFIKVCISFTEMICSVDLVSKTKYALRNKMYNFFVGYLAELHVTIT